MAKNDESKDEPKAPAKADLAPAGEASDPEVHNLLGEREVLERNLAEYDVTDDDKDQIKELKAQIAENDKALAEKGYVV